MGREIMFRGKHVHAFSCNEKMDGSWLYGYLSDKNYIHSPELECERLVDPKTVGQYTGLKDKHGKMIFEGDIVIYDNTPYNVYSTPKTGVIVWRKNAFSLKYREYETYWYFGLGCDDFFCAKCEVLGNIHDNPELLEAK